MNTDERPEKFSPDDTATLDPNGALDAGGARTEGLTAVLGVVADVPPAPLGVEAAVRPQRVIGVGVRVVLRPAEWLRVLGRSRAAAHRLVDWDPSA
jgi:hypothetical protein